MERPDFKDIKTGEAFNRWYWLKKEMIQICKAAQLPTSGSKFELRDRIMYALDHQGKLNPEIRKKRSKSKFDWAKSKLTPDTKITDNITFGQNLRQFMKSQIGDHFSFNTDFMAWAKTNVGKTLADAVVQWTLLEERKQDPHFRTDIAEHNMFNQYLRDFLDDNKGLNFATAKTCWLLKKQMPMKDGFVRYERSDLELIHQSK